MLLDLPRKKCWHNKMHFKLDENIPALITDILEEAGFEASTVYAQGLSGIKDAHLAKHCKSKKYALITLDNDFCHTAIYPPKEHIGIIVLRPKSQGRIAITKFFEKFMTRFDIKNVQHKTIIVEEQHIRIRN